MRLSLPPLTFPKDIHDIMLLKSTLLSSVVLALASLADSHCTSNHLGLFESTSDGMVTTPDTFPQLLVNGAATGNWVNVRRTDNYNSNGPVSRYLNFFQPPPRMANPTYIEKVSLTTCIPRLDHRRLLHQLPLLQPSRWLRDRIDRARFRRGPHWFQG